MKVDVLEKSALGRELVFEVDSEKVDEERKSIIKEIRNTAVVEGFRKGKVPENIIENKYGEDIKENLLKRMIPDVYLKAVKEKKLVPAVQPDVFDVSLDEGVLKFKVYVELKPEVNIKKYKGISVKKRVPAPVKEEDVDKTLEEWEKRPEFASAIVDPSKRRAWREKINAQLEEYSKARARLQEEKELWSTLLGQNDFPVPEKLVNEQAVRYTEEHLGRMDIKNKSKEEQEKLAREIFEKVKPDADLSVKRYFILDKVAELENIESSQEDVDARLHELSRAVGESFEKVKEKMEKADKISDVKDEIRIQKAFRFLMENADFIKKVILPGEERENKPEVIK